MKTLKHLFILLSITIVFNCSGEDSESNDDDPEVENVLCDGDGSDSYFPLAMGNFWKWEYPCDDCYCPRWA